MECYSCRQNEVVDDLPPRELIALDRFWRVSHAFGTELPGWLVLLPRRHVTSVAELTDAEAADLGLWQVRLSRALHAVTGCAKTYVVQFAEAPGFGHVHFHVVPRMADLAEDRRGVKVFGYLGATGTRAVTDERRDEVARAVREHL